MGIACSSGEFVAAKRNFNIAFQFIGIVMQPKGRAVNELCIIAQFSVGEVHKHLFIAVKICFNVEEINAKLFMNLFIKVFQKLLTGFGHGLVDLRAQLRLKLVEGGCYFFRCAAVLVDVINPLFKITPGFYSTKHFVTGAEDSLKERKLFCKNFINPLVCLVILIQEVDHDNVMLLPIAMATAYALLNALGVPGQVVVHYERTELQVNPLGSGFSCDHDLPSFLKVINKGRTHVSGAGASYPISSFVALKPGCIYLPGPVVIV